MAIFYDFPVFELKGEELIETRKKKIGPLKEVFVDKRVLDEINKKTQDVYSSYFKFQEDIVKRDNEKLPLYYFLLGSNLKQLVLNLLDKKLFDLAFVFLDNDDSVCLGYDRKLPISQLARNEWDWPYTHIIKFIEKKNSSFLDKLISVSEVYLTKTISEVFQPISYVLDVVLQNKTEIDKLMLPLARDSYNYNLLKKVKFSKEKTDLIKKINTAVEEMKNEKINVRRVALHLAVSYSTFRDRIVRNNIYFKRGEFIETFSNKPLLMFTETIK